MIPSPNKNPPNRFLEKGAVSLWHLRFDENMPSLSTYLKVLSKDERVKADRFKFDLHRKRYIIGRGVLRMLLGRYLDCPPQSLDFKYTEYGKPYLEHGVDLNFNISHSGDRAVLAFTRDSEMGVDIEKCKSNFDHLEIAQNFFSPDEIRTLEALPEVERAAGFYRCWTRKESFIKAKGSGLSFSLTSFSVSLDPEDATLLRTDWNPEEREQWRLASFIPEKGYLGALSIKSELRSLDHFHWSVN